MSRDVYHVDKESKAFLMDKDGLSLDGKVSTTISDHLMKTPSVELGEEGDFDQKSDIPPREHWPHHMDFILSCVGYAVGFGSIWRFPYLCYKNGGGAFLIPYAVFMLICGVPLFYLELAVGQYSGASPLAMWNICPLFKGVGWGMIIVSGLVCIYYNIILTWVLYYLVLSFTTKLPWSTCSNWWNTCYCRETKYNTDASANSLLTNWTASTIEYLVSTLPPDLKDTFITDNQLCNDTTPLNVSLANTSSAEFWKYNTLEQSAGIDQLDGLNWKLTLCLVAAWVMIYACLCKGVKSIGKVVYVTATSPYVFLFILLVRNCMLPGAAEGIKFYIKPDFDKLKNLHIWHEAALQVFFALGPGWGGLITMASFNKFKNNCYRDSLFVPLINFLTSILGGFVIFSVIGFMANQTGKNIEDVVSKGPGLVFVAYPEAIAQMPAAPVWAVFFFLMLITIGVDSQFGMFETMTSSFIDEFPRLLRKKKVLFVAFMCLVECLLGLPIVTKGGIYIFTIFDWFIGTFALCFITLFEVVVIGYIYGINRFRGNIEEMVGFKPSHFWTVMWCGVTPTALIAILISICTRFTNPVIDDYEFPTGAIIFGWCIGCASILVIPFVAVIRIIQVGKGSLIERIRFLLKPSDLWGPAIDLEDTELSRKALTTKELREGHSVQLMK